MAPAFVPDAAAVAPAFSQSALPEVGRALGWPLGTMALQSRSSNFLGWVTFTVPATATSGQVYAVGFTNLSGGLDRDTSYTLETRSATVVVNGSAPAASICSDEWKAHFFGGPAGSLAADTSDPDGDGVPNWMEYLAGTDPTDRTSRLQFNSAARQGTAAKAQMAVGWLTAPGRAYEVQWATNLTKAPWSTLTTVAGDGAPTGCLDTNATGATRFYRLRLLP